MGLFSYIPQNLFSVMSGPLKHVHADLLLLVYDQYRKTIYTIDREIIIDLFTEYLESQPEEISIFDNETEESCVRQDTRERAFHFLRKFLETEWLVQEQHLDLTFKISLPDYSLRLLETMQKIMTGYQMEFRGHVLSIYLNMAGEEEPSFVALQQAYETTLNLIDGLKSLNHNIKRYTEKLLEAEDVQQILEQIFDEYEVKVLGAQYYRLKTSDHVSKYRTGIIEAVNNWQYNKPLISEQARVMAQEKQVKSEIEGENTIYEWLEVIERSFEHMDEILEEIDSRNRQYARAASQQVRFHLLQSGSMEGKLNKLLTYLADQIRGKGEKALTDDGINCEVAVFRQSFIDEKSIRLPAQAARKHKPTPVERRTVDPIAKKKRLNLFKKRVSDEVTINQINQYVLDALKSNDQLHLSEMPFHTKGDWMKLIYSVVFSTSKRANYNMSEKNEGQRSYQVQSGIVPNRSITKKRDN